MLIEGAIILEEEDWGFGGIITSICLSLLSGILNLGHLFSFFQHKIEFKKIIVFTNYIRDLLEMTPGHVANTASYDQLPFILKITQNKQLFRMQ